MCYVTQVLFNVRSMCIAASITTRLFGILKGNMLLEVELDVSCVRCKRRPATYYGPTGCAGIDPGRGGFPGRRTGGLPPALCSVVLSTRTARLGSGLSARTAHGRCPPQECRSDGPAPVGGGAACGTAGAGPPAVDRGRQIG